MGESMKIFITGGTGFVGTGLTRRLLDRGHEVTVVSSSGKSHLKNSISTFHNLQADTTEKGSWQESLGSYDVIINLAGRSIFNYWSDSYKKKIYNSRVKTTQNVVDALPAQTSAILLSASAVGYYGDSGDAEQDESGAPGSDYLAKVGVDWETEAFHAREKGARVAVMRFGIVLGEGGGAIETMKTPFKLGMGGPIGDGSQYFSWIHIEDLIEAILFLMDSSALEGPFNCTAPEPVRQKDFAKELGSVLHRPAILPAPSFVLKTFGGDFGEMLLQGQKVVPKALLDHGFTFRYPKIKQALEAIFS